MTSPTPLKHSNPRPSNTRRLIGGLLDSNIWCYYLDFRLPEHKHVTEPVKKTPCLFAAAGELLYQLYHTRLVEDGRRRPAFAVTASFLFMNDAAPYETDLNRIIVFMRQLIVHCNSKDIAEWLKNGEK